MEPDFEFADSGESYQKLVILDIVAWNARSLLKVEQQELSKTEKGLTNHGANDSNDWFSV